DTRSFESYLGSRPGLPSAGVTFFRGNDATAPLLWLTGFTRFCSASPWCFGPYPSRSDDVDDTTGATRRYCFNLSSTSGSIRFSNRSCPGRATPNRWEIQGLVGRGDRGPGGGPYPVH